MESPLDGCHQIFLRNKNFIDQKVAAGQAPLTEQLAEFLRTLVMDLMLHIPRCDPEVREFFKDKFAGFGWDVSQNCSLSPSPPTMHQVKEFLDGVTQAAEMLKSGMNLSSVRQSQMSGFGTQKPVTTGWEAANEKFAQREREIINQINRGVKVGTGAVLTQGSANSIALSGEDKAEMWANRPENKRLWNTDHIDEAYDWFQNSGTSLPNKRKAGGGRLLKLTNMLWNACEFVHTVISRDATALSRYPDRTDEGRKQYIAPLAKALLKMLEEEEEDQKYQSDDEDFEM
mmetsp:Transcript_1536/g.2207  ORF Transcript_1536/g.2207 Transcript_1536/m.2207 type:complete len:287 (+) Transcript_1536:100-960(+)